MPSKTKSADKLSAREKARSKARLIPPQDYDTPWKIAVENYFCEFMAFFFPLAFAQIDWTIKPQFLSKELKKIAKDAVVGAKHVDELIKVTRLSGEEEWICIHIEVQVSRDPNFERRMFIYNYRIFDYYNKPVFSMAVLGDDDPAWLPQQFSYAGLGCEMGLRFPIAKLLNFSEQEAALETNPNPFALLTLAYLKNRATRSDMLARYEVKCRLVRLLHARQWDKKVIREFFLVIDWMINLPPDLESRLSHFVIALEEEQKMEYVSTVERFILEKKRQEGESAMLSSLLSRLLTRRFGGLPQWVHERVKNASKAQIESWFDRGVDATTLDDVFQDLPH